MGAAGEAVDGDAETWEIRVVWEVASHFVHYTVASFDYNTHCTYFLSTTDYSAYLWPDSDFHN